MHLEVGPWELLFVVAHGLSGLLPELGLNVCCFSPPTSVVGSLEKGKLECFQTFINPSQHDWIDPNNFPLCSFLEGNQKTIGLQESFQSHSPKTMCTHPHTHKSNTSALPSIKPTENIAINEIRVSSLCFGEILKPWALLDSGLSSAAPHTYPYLIIADTLSLLSYR